MNKFTEIKNNIFNFFKKVYLYRKLLLKDQDYDYGYLLNLERFKLVQLNKYFKNSTICDHEHNIKWITICIKLINIINEEDSAVDFTDKKWKLLKYVNINNDYRFGLDHNLYTNQIDFKDLLRQQKALYLYHKIRYNYILYWWD